MFKTFAAALLAASVIASPVLAQGTAQGTASKPATTEMTKAPHNKAAVKTVKGKSHKAIAYETGRSERTVRQHAVTVYQKSGLAGRAELAAFFLEGLVLPS